MKSLWKGKATFSGDLPAVTQVQARVMVAVFLGAGRKRRRKRRMRRRRRKRRVMRRRRRRRRNKYLHYPSDSTGIIMKVALLNRFCYIPSQGP